MRSRHRFKIFCMILMPEIRSSKTFFFYFLQRSKKRMSDLEGKAKRANEMAETRRDEVAKLKALADKAKKMHESLEKEVSLCILLLNIF